MSDYTQLMLAQLAPQFAAANRTRDPYSAPRSFGLKAMQQGMSTAPVGSWVEGIARALQGGLGGYMVNRTNERQDTEEKENAQALAAALQATKRVKGADDVERDEPDIAGMTAALARNPQHAGMAAMLRVASIMQGRQNDQTTERARILLGGGAPPGGAPPAGAPSTGGGYPPSSFPPGQRAPVERTDGGPDYDIPEDFFKALQHGRNGSVPESGGQNIPNQLPGGGSSGAFGYFQIMPDTWADIRRSNPQLNLPENIRQATYEQQRAGIGAYHNTGAKLLAGAGLPVTAGNLYLVQRFGADGAGTLLRADPGTPIEQLVPPAWVAQNPDLRGPVGRYIQQAQSRFGDIPINPRGGQPQAAGQPPAMQPPQGAPPMPQAAVQPPQAPQVVSAEPYPAQGADTPQGGFGTVPMPPGMIADDGSRDLMTARQLLSSNDVVSQRMGQEYLKAGQAKQAAAQQRIYDRQFKPAERVTGPDGIVRPTTGGAADPAVIENEAAARARGGGASRVIVKDGVEYQEDIATGKLTAMPTVAPKWMPATEGGRSGQRNVATGEFKPDAAPTEGQSKTASRLIRMVAAGPTLDAYESFGTQGGQRFLDHVPGGIGNYAQTKEYQKFRTAAEAWIVGHLRDDSGGAITKEEWAKYGPIYFPQPGDHADVVAFKRTLRASVEAGMKEQTAPGFKMPDRATVPTPDNAPTLRGAPPANHVDALKANPGLAAQFDEKYGPGASDRVLKGGR